MPACPADASIDLPLARRSNGGDYLPLSRDKPLDAMHPILNQPVSTRGCLNVLQKMAFPGLWLFIGMVSAFDTYLTVRFQEYLAYEEINPLARMLLQLNGWDASLLIGMKFLGSVVVLGVLTALHLTDRRFGLVIAAAIASFQLGLLGYLVLA
jgi:hypothetical protein